MLFFISLFNIIAIAGIAFWWWRSLDGATRIIFWPALIWKLAAGIGVGLLYKYYYSSGDTFQFFSAAEELTNLFYSSISDYSRIIFQEVDLESAYKGEWRTAFFVKMISAVNIFTNNNYWVSSLWFSFLSFLASFYFFRNVIKHFPNSEVIAALAFLFFPSVIFWSSGIIKESVGLAALFILSTLYLKLIKNERPLLMDFLLAMLSGWILWRLKYYWLAVFLPAAFTSLIVQYVFLFFKIPSRYKLISWIGLFLLLCFGVSLIHPNFYLERFLDVVVENNQAFVAISEPEDIINYDSLKATWPGIAANSPWALFSGLFRPFVWEADNPLKFVNAIENLLILVLCLSSFGRIKSLFWAQQRLLTFSVCVYIVLLCIFLSLSTPNMGSLSRYKVGFTPFLIFLMGYQNPLIERVAQTSLFRKLKETVRGYL